MFVSSDLQFFILSPYFWALCVPLANHCTQGTHFPGYALNFLKASLFHCPVIWTDLFKKKQKESRRRWFGEEKNSYCFLGRGQLPKWKLAVCDLAHFATKYTRFLKILERCIWGIRDNTCWFSLEDPMYKYQLNTASNIIGFVSYFIIILSLWKGIYTTYLQKREITQVVLLSWINCSQKLIL